MLEHGNFSTIRVSEKPILTLAFSEPPFLVPQTKTIPLGNNSVLEREVPSKRKKSPSRLSEPIYRSPYIHHTLSNTQIVHARLRISLSYHLHIPVPSPLLPPPHLLELLSSQLLYAFNHCCVCVSSSLPRGTVLPSQIENITCMPPYGVYKGRP